MDCRLIEFSENLITNLNSYYINIFRKIYQNIFNDNDYREDYNTKTPMTSIDLSQFLKNIFSINNRLEFYNFIR